MREAEWSLRVIGTAQLHRWVVCHVRPAMTQDGWETAIEGDPGLPDLMLARMGVVAFRELKTNTGPVSMYQRRWLHHLGDLGGIWRPRDWPEVLAFLSAPVEVVTQPHGWAEFLQRDMAKRTRRRWRRPAGNDHYDKSPVQED